MSRMRVTIAKNMKNAQNTAASLTTFQDCDMYNLSVRAPIFLLFFFYLFFLFSFLPSIYDKFPLRHVQSQRTCSIFKIDNECACWLWLVYVIMSIIIILAALFIWFFCCYTIYFNMYFYFISVSVFSNIHTNFSFPLNSNCARSTKTNSWRDTEWSWALCRRLCALPLLRWRRCPLLMRVCI